MDKNKLLTIAVTALITVTVTETAKWLFAWARITAVSDTTKQKAKTIFSKTNLAIIWNSVWLVFNAIMFVKYVRRTTPITRADVVMIPLTLFASGFWLLALMWSLLNRFKKYD
jgi:hypothetical protein